MKSFFFVPASKLHKTSDVESQQPDAIIIDFEDAINKDFKYQYLKQIPEQSNFLDFWYRIPVITEEGTADVDFLQQFQQLGITQFIIPKAAGVSTFIDLDNQLTGSKIDIIVLVEGARLFVELKELLTYSFQQLNIVGLGLGAHDLVTELGIPFSPENIAGFRSEVLVFAKAYKKLPIDIASMNIGDKDSFFAETEAGKAMGYVAKFVIHPRQLDWLKEATQPKPYETERAKSIVAALPPGKALHEIEPFVLEGEIIERMHIEHALRILNQTI